MNNELFQRLVFRTTTSLRIRSCRAKNTAPFDASDDTKRSPQLEVFDSILSPVAILPEEIFNRGQQVFKIACAFLCLFLLHKQKKEEDRDAPRQKVEQSILYLKERAGFS